MIFLIDAAMFVTYRWSQMDQHAEEVITLGAEIRELRRELAAKESKFAALLARQASTGAPSSSAPSPTASGQSYADRIRGVLMGAPGRNFHVRDLQRVLPDVKPQLLRSTVNRLSRDEDGFESPGRGVYVFQQTNGAVTARP